MIERSRLKKAAVISVVGLFGLAGLGAIAGPQQNNVSPPPTPNPTSVQGTETETEPQVEPAPEPASPPIVTPTPIPTSPPEPADNCVSGYSPCISPGSDVDCGGGNGNGPRYIAGPVYVTGSDPYDLDRDGDGVGCE